MKHSILPIRSTKKQQICAKQICQPYKGKPIVATYGVAVETFGPNESRYSKPILARYEIYHTILPQFARFVNRFCAFTNKYLNEKPLDFPICLVQNTESALFLLQREEIADIISKMHKHPMKKKEG